LQPASPTSFPAGSDAEEAHLATAAPLTARNVLYVGKDFRTFAAAYRLRNPKADLRALPSAASGGDPEAASDLVVVGPGADLDGILSQALVRPGGALVLAGAPAAPAPSPDVTGAGFAVVKTHHGSSGPIWVAQHRADAAGPKLHVELLAFAPRLMDIRTRLPMQQLDTEPAVSAYFRTAPFRLPDIPVDTARVAICQRPRIDDLDQMRNLLAPILAGGWIPVLEIDDHPDLMAGVKGNSSSDNVWTTTRAMAAVQTSTSKLAQALLVHNPEVKVFPNAVFELPPFPEGDRPRRVFYGAISRGPFAVDVARSLSPVVRQFPDTEFVVVGDRAVFDALPTRRKRFEEYIPYERYLALMRTCSVTLSPLAGGAPEETKSDAKFLDAAQSGALMVASPVVYGEVVRHGQNGLIARSREQWAPLLASALRNQVKRREMARCAWEEVRAKRMFVDQIAERRDWYLSLWHRREALERELCARLPGLADAIRAHRR
jgi:hypothetical protein